MKKTFAERKGFAKKRGLSFGCLTQGHISKECPTKNTCDICNQSHPTSLRGDVRTSRTENVSSKNGLSDCVEESTTNCTKALVSIHEREKSNAMIVPVWLHHVDNPKKERLVYAILDDQSNTTFIKEITIMALGITGPKTQLLLSTMHAENKPISSRKIMVSHISREVTIKLPKTIYSERIPARRNQIPRLQTARK